MPLWCGRLFFHPIFPFAIIMDPVFQNVYILVFQFRYSMSLLDFYDIISLVYLFGVLQGGKNEQKAFYQNFNVDLCLFPFLMARW